MNQNLLDLIFEVLNERFRHDPQVIAYGEDGDTWDETTVEIETTDDETAAIVIQTLDDHFNTPSNTLLEFYEMTDDEDGHVFISVSVYEY